MSLDPTARAMARRDLDRIANAPEAFEHDTTTFLALRAARHRLTRDRRPEAVTEAQEILWEIAIALEEGRAHIAVHSLKDVPMELPEGFALACVMEREDPRDAFVSPRYASLEALPQGAVVGTSSLRRQVLLQALRPDLKIEPLRGNLDTRLRKLDEGQYDAIVLAAAGLKRLKMGERVRATFAPTAMLPAAGQGALGIEVRSDRQDLIDALAPLAHMPTWLTVTAERAVSRAMGGSCSMPLAAHGTLTGTTLQLDAAWGDTEGKLPLVRASASATVTTLAQADALGLAIAQQLRDGGAVGATPATAG
jgi:hydroxymethylbilane synthase